MCAIRKVPTRLAGGSDALAMVLLDEDEAEVRASQAARSGLASGSYPSCRVAIGEREVGSRFRR